MSTSSSADSSILRVCFLVLERVASGRPGPSEVVWDMSRELAAAGHEVHVVLPHGAAPSPASQIHLHFFQPPPAGDRWFLGQLWSAKRMCDLVRSLQVDIIHAPEYLSTAVLATLDRRRPIVLTVPGNIFQRLSMPEGNQSSFLYTETIKWAARVSASRCARVIAFTREMKQWWEWTGSSPEHTPLIPYGVDIEHFRPIADARKHLAIAPDHLMLLYVGRLDREKGIFDALEALVRLRSMCSIDWLRLDLVGTGALRDELVRTIAHEGLQSQVYLHGSKTKEELPLWYSAADALLLPSWVEPFGRVLLEAMACGTPVLATDTGGPRDHVFDGDNGYLFPARDPVALAERLRAIVTAPDVLREMRPGALSYVSQKLSWERVTERIVAEVYRPILCEARVTETGT